jgi:hypothetical protein
MSAAGPIDPNIDQNMDTNLSDLEDTAEEYGLDGEYDFVTEDNLEDGAVAATAKVPGVSAVEIEDYEDLVEYDLKMVDDEGNLYGLEKDEHIGFISDSEVYGSLGNDLKEHVDVHELQHLQQYSEGRLWGNVLDEEYNLSDEMRFQLNYVDNLMDVAEDPILGELVDDGMVTALVEGYTQRVTEALQENGQELGEDFYPGYTQLAEYMMEEVYGTDPEQEFDPDIDPNTAIEEELESGSVTMDTDSDRAGPKAVA